MVALKVVVVKVECEEKENKQKLIGYGAKQTVCGSGHYTEK